MIAWRWYGSKAGGSADEKPTVWEVHGDTQHSVDRAGIPNGIPRMDDMKFTDGTWTTRAGYRIHPATQLQKASLSGNALKALVICHALQSGNDRTFGPALEFTFAPEGPDMVRVTMTHYRGVAPAKPAFSLFREEVDSTWTESSEAFCLACGKLTLEVRKESPFSYRFQYDGKFLTGSGNGSAAYVSDAEYESNQMNDYNHNRPQKPYMEDAWLRERLNLDVGEWIYGLGEHFTPLIKNGQHVDVWNRDGGSNSDQGYKCIPFYLSSRGYGVFVDTPDHVDFEVGTESVRHVQFSVEAERLDYVVIGAAEPKQVLERYTALTGRSPVPPAWSFGLWLSTSWMPDSTADTALAAVDGMLSRGIPLSVYHFDARWMDDFHDCDFVWSDRYGDVKDMIAKIHARGVKVCVWINPYVSQASRLFDEGMEKGYFIKKKNGDVWQSDTWMLGMAIVDFTNPEASRWYANRLGEVLDMGVDTVKTDFGERIPTEVVYFDGSDSRRMHNYYPFLYNQAIYNLLVEKKGEKEACVFARSATAGTQQFPVHWGGDNLASYVSMAETLRGGLSFCQSGFGFWSHDISGFSSTATPDLYKRWAAFGLLSTHSRLHGSETERVPWLFDEESCEVLGHYSRLKNTMMPYLFAEAVKVNRTGQPMMRAMMLDFPEDPTCVFLDRQYLLGENLLVAPVMSETGEVTFYVPQGNWTDFQTGAVLKGPGWHKGTYDYFHLPLLVRPNSVLALGAEAMHASYDYAENTEFRFYALDEGHASSCTVYGSDAEERLFLRVSRQGDQISLVMRDNSSASRRASESTRLVEDDGRRVQEPLSWSCLAVGLRLEAVEGLHAEQVSDGTRLVPIKGSARMKARIVFAD